MFNLNCDKYYNIFINRKLNLLINDKNKIIHLIILIIIK